MKNTTLIIILALLASCTNASKNTGSQIIKTSSDKSKIADTAPALPHDLKTEFSQIFLKTVNLFPDDSASLYRFYYKWHPAKDADHLKKQIIRLEMLTSEESVKQYNDVAGHLKRLLTQIVSSNVISKAQADSLGKLYSDYDYFSGEALFSELLTDDDNYNLVWKSFQLMAMESNRDTSYISVLIRLDHDIRTNVELSQAMPDFIVKAIQNNPLGFLDMYNARKDRQSEFASYISIFDNPDKQLVDQFSDIAKNPENKQYRILATDLLQDLDI